MRNELRGPIWALGLVLWFWFYSLARMRTGAASSEPRRGRKVFAALCKVANFCARTKNKCIRIVAPLALFSAQTPRIAGANQMESVTQERQSNNQERASGSNR